MHAYGLRTPLQFSKVVYGLWSLIVLWDDTGEGDARVVMIIDCHTLVA